MEIGQKLNGKFEVIAIREIVRYGKYFSNKTVKAQFYVRGLRGSVFLGHLSVTGHWKIERSSTDFQSFQGHVRYDGEANCLVDDAQQLVSMLEAWTLSRHGIGAKVAVTSTTISFSVKTIYSAFTLLRDFNRHKASVTAHAYMDYQIDVPLSEAKRLLA